MKKISLSIALGAALLLLTAQSFPGVNFTGAGQMITSNSQKSTAIVQAGTSGQVLTVGSNGYPSFQTSPAFTPTSPFQFTSNPSLISEDTDAKELQISGGSALGSTHGASLDLFGATSGSVGTFQLFTAANANGDIGTLGTGILRFFSNSSYRWGIDPTIGTLIQDITNGGPLVMPKAITAGFGVILGTTAINSDTTATMFHAQGDSAVARQASFTQATADANGNVVTFYKTRKTDGTADTVVVNGDKIITFQFKGADGATFQNAAAIVAGIDAVPGGSDMPGFVDFQTTTDGGTTLSSALRLGNSQSVTFTGSLVNSTAGKTLSIKGGGAAATAGTFTCNGVTGVVVSTTSASASMVLAFSPNAISGTAPVGSPYVSAFTAATSFTVKCSVIGETSVYNWALLNVG